MVARFTLVVLAAALLAPLSVAQMRGGRSFRPMAVEPSFGQACFGHLGHHHNFVQAGYYPGGVPFFFADYPLYDYPYAPPAEPAAPQVIVLEKPVADATPEVKASPLLIELQGDRYVRYGGVQPPSDRTGKATADSAQQVSTRIVPAGSAASRAEPRAGAVANPAPAELPPAVLVYRDGHREEASSYAIVGGILYAQGADWQSGYWSKQIPLSALDLRATMRANQESGVRFVLPSAPNEVVTRP